MARTSYAALWTGFTASVLTVALAVEADTVPAATPPAARAGQSQTDRIRGLVEAAAHLKAAGEFELARQVRREAGDAINAERERLRTALDDLEQLDAALERTRVLIATQVIQVDGLSVDALARAARNADASPIGLDHPDSSEPPGAWLLRTGMSEADFVQMLSEDGGRLSRVSCPSVSVPEGQTGSIQIGEVGPVLQGVQLSQDGTAQPVTGQAFSGIELSLNPAEIQEGIVDLKITTRCVKKSESAVPIFTDRAGKVFESPILEERACQASFNIPNDRVLVLPAFVPVARGNATPAAHPDRYLLFVFHPTFDVAQ